MKQMIYQCATELYPYIPFLLKIWERERERERRAIEQLCQFCFCTIAKNMSERKYFEQQFWFTASITKANKCPKMFSFCVWCKIVFHSFFQCFSLVFNTVESVKFIIIQIQTFCTVLIWKEKLNPSIFFKHTYKNKKKVQG